MNTRKVFTVDMANAMLRRFVMETAHLPEEYVLIETRMQPRPYDDKPYVTIYWKSHELLNQFDGDMTFEPELVEYPVATENRENPTLCTVRMTVRGDNAYNIAAELRYALESSNRNFDLWSVLGFAGCTGPVDLSAVYGGKVQQRAHIELSFYAAFGRAYDLDYFTSAPFVINGEKSIYPKEKEKCRQLP